MTCHGGVIVTSCSFFICVEHPFLGALPDALIECNCCGQGFMAMKFLFGWVYHTQCYQQLYSWLLHWRSLRSLASGGGAKKFCEQSERKTIYGLTNPKMLPPPLQSCTDNMKGLMVVLTADAWQQDITLYLICGVAFFMVCLWRMLEKVHGC